MLILDSNTISYYFRGDPHVVPCMQALSPADIGVPAIVEYELRYGLLRLAPAVATPRLDALSALLDEAATRRKEITLRLLHKN